MDRTDFTASDVEFEEADAGYRQASKEFDRARTCFIEATQKRERALRKSSWVRAVFDTSGKDFNG